MEPCSNVSTKNKAIDKSIYLEMESEDGHGYIVVVVEYQKRGLHHAHIAYRPAKSPASKNLPIGAEVPWVDNIICAQQPTDENKQDIMDRFGLTNDEFDKLRQVVRTTMTHDKNQQHKRTDPNEKIWCFNEEGRCKSFYPKPYDPNQSCSTVDEKGYVK